MKQITIEDFSLTDMATKKPVVLLRLLEWMLDKGYITRSTRQIYTKTLLLLVVEQGIDVGLAREALRLFIEEFFATAREEPAVVPPSALEIVRSEEIFAKFMELVTPAPTPPPPVEEAATLADTQPPEVEPPAPTPINRRTRRRR